MRILITGASGLLGLNLALSAAADSTQEHIVFGTFKHQPLQTDAFTVIQTDLLLPAQLERLLDQAQPDWVIHCAALANVDACESDPALAHQLNTELTRKLAQRMSPGAERAWCTSPPTRSSMVCAAITREQDAPNPLGVYARTKLAGERGVAQANPQPSLPASTCLAGAWLANAAWLNSSSTT